MPLLASLLPLHTNAEPRPPLPEPLTLAAALSTVDDQHPATMRARATADLANADRDTAAAGDDIRLGLSLEARRLDLSDRATLVDEDDSRAILSLQKTLYDFGRTRHASAAGEQHAIAAQYLSRLANQQQRLKIMQRYLDVILADLESAQATEGMSISFVRFDNAKERQALGELADVDLLALENKYQSDLRAKNLADNQQRLSRARLALAMNYPEDLPADLEEPGFTQLTGVLPEPEKLLQQARQNNLTLQALKAELEGGLERQWASMAERHPTLYMELQAAEYQQEFGSRAPFTAIVGLDIPLYQGGRVDAKARAAQATTLETESRLLVADYRLSEQILGLWQSITQLTSQLEQADIQSEYRELYLDRSRARYELEINTDLGDAMVAQSAARLFEAKTRFELAIAREKLALLTQDSEYSALAKPATLPAEVNSNEAPHDP